MVQALPSSHKEQNNTLHFPSSQANEHKLVHSMDCSSSSRTRVSLLGQINCHPSCSMYNGVHIKQSLTVLSNIFHVSFNLHFN